MTKAIIVLLIIAAMFLVPWWFERSARSKTRTEQAPADKGPASRKRRRRIGWKRRWKYEQETYPAYDPTKNDEFIWRTEIEPKYRKFSGRPPDWQRRRALVYVRDKGKCQKCGRQCGHLACEPNQIWCFNFDEQLLYDADVHHAMHQARGGDHDLKNLLLHCVRCHSIEHPKSSALSGRLAWQGLGGGNVKNSYRRKAPKPRDNDVPF